MKRKGMFRLFTCLLAVVLCITAFSMTAFASGEDEPIEPTETGAEENAPSEPTGEAAADSFPISDELMDTLLSLFGGNSDDTQETQKTGKVTTNGGNLNVRTGAGLENTAFTQLENGETVEVIGTDGDWVMIRLPERIGYVYSDYLTVTETGIEVAPTIDPEALKELMKLFAEMMKAGQTDTETDNNNALTPDGNMNLIDDIGTTEAGGKQFITVETKNGNVFYLIIDRDDKGEATVHFLNQVDESDLLALMGETETETAPIVCSCTDKCKASAINTSCTLCMTNMSECVGAEPTPAEPTEPEPAEDGESGSNAALVVLVLVVLAAGGGAAAYFFIIKPKQGGRKNIPDPDDFDLEDEEDYLSDDETEESE